MRGAESPGCASPGAPVRRSDSPDDRPSEKGGLEQDPADLRWYNAAPSFSKTRLANGLVRGIPTDGERDRSSALSH